MGGGNGRGEKDWKDTGEKTESQKIIGCSLLSENISFNPLYLNIWIINISFVYH